MVSQPALEDILVSNCVYPHFCDVIQNYGTKEREYQRNWTGTRYSITQRQIDGQLDWQHGTIAPYLHVASGG